MTITDGRIAVIGGGIAGMGAAWAINQHKDVVLYEAADRLGGHAHTVTPDIDGRPVPVDVGFIVYNQHNYPNLVAFFQHLGVETYESDMSFAVSADQGTFEYAGSLAGLLAQPGNLIKPRFWSMLADLLRFYRTAPEAIRASDPGITIGQFLTQKGYGQAFIHDHLLPMGAAIWSSAPNDMTAYPARRFISFFENHRLLNLGTRPVWRSVRGGSQSYVAKVAASLGERVRTAAPVVAVEPMGDKVVVRNRHGGRDIFDEVVFACHGDQALALLGNKASATQKSVLSAFSYQKNDAYLHRDRDLMPKRRAVWSSWNYMAPARSHVADADQRPCSVSYWMNALQDLTTEHDLFVTLNPDRPPRDDLTLGAYSFDHPHFDQAAIRAQSRLPTIQGENRLWFCGSYCGYGFHEDGLQAGLSVAAALGCPAPWTERISPMSPAANCVVPNTLARRQANRQGASRTKRFYGEAAE
ncbi:MAG: FAD-dependent oxidoreductase [Pseudomonadota bacterium]